MIHITTTRMRFVGSRMGAKIDMKKKNYTIGILGGMGTYATIDFFKRLADAFPAEKEWDRPRIIIDNYCTMPSRVRALLYNERKEELINDMSSSVNNFLQMGVNRIVFACNTSHCFLPSVIEKIPASAERFVHIIRKCAEEVKEKRTETELIASEGTIDSGIYKDVFAEYGISVLEPDKEKYQRIRSFIEAVKQNDISDTIKTDFEDYIENSSMQSVILGCTELPILYQSCLQDGYRPSKDIFDPLQSTINYLVREYNSLD